MPELTDSEVGKTVVDAEGKELGIIAKVEGDTAYVDPDPSLAETVMAKVGWESEDEEDYEVTEAMVDSVGDEIVLRGEI